MPQNLLYYGDNLPILRQHIADASVNLIYLDPPFKSNQDYNLLFREQDGTRAAAQIKAFKDTWRWDAGAVRDYQEVVEGGGVLSRTLQALRMIVGDSDMLAYLTRMAPRLTELRRVLKPTGSIYLHCDPTASHYLKMLMDAVFGPENFRNEIVWNRTMAKGLMTRRLPTNHDTILSYQGGGSSVWNRAAVFRPYNPNDLDEKTAKKYCFQDDDGRRYQLTSLLNPNHNRPNLTYEFLGVTRVWRWKKARMKAAYDAGLVVQPSPGAVPRFKRYLDQQKGKPLGDIWADIPPLNSQAAERLGYQTQKPEALLERIMYLTTREGDTVLDPFCGCGTAVSVAQRLGRRWIGIDITHLAITLIRTRLKDAFGESVVKSYKVEGEPVSVFDAAALAAQDRHQFQWWALSLVGARPTPPEQKKGKDRGIDGRLYFHDEPEGGETKQVIFSVKSGGTGVKDVRDLVGVVTREKAAIGVLISLEETTRDMRTEAAEAGDYVSPWGGFKCPKIQLLTIEELFDGAKVILPPHGGISTFKKAPRAKGTKPVQKRFFE